MTGLYDNDLAALSVGAICSRDMDTGIKRRAAFAVIVCASGPRGENG